MKRYLRIAVGTNKFCKYYIAIGEAVLAAFRSAGGRYPTDNDDLEILKEFICQIFCAITNIGKYSRVTDEESRRNLHWVSEYTFSDIYLEIVECQRIPESVNYSNIFIPLSDESSRVLLI